MPHWVMVIDLSRCTGCQTCMVSCKVENALAPNLQRVVVSEKEVGTYPKVTRLYVPKRCMNCQEPQCVAVCPSGATVQQEDGIVTIDQDTCIGCRYCMMACPYDARFFHGVEQSYHDQPSTWEQQRYPEHTVGVVDKCNFCRDRITEAAEDGLTPGIDQDATPFCVIACMAGALHFGDLDDPDSEVSIMIKQSRGFVLKPEQGTNPKVYYLPPR